MKVSVCDDDNNVIEHIENNTILDGGGWEIDRYKGLTRLDGEGRYAEIMGFYYEYATLIGPTRAQELIYENKNKSGLLKKFPELEKMKIYTNEKELPKNDYYVRLYACTEDDEKIIDERGNWKHIGFISHGGNIGYICDPDYEHTDEYNWEKEEWKGLLRVTIDGVGRYVETTDRVGPHGEWGYAFLCSAIRAKWLVENGENKEALYKQFPELKSVGYNEDFERIFQD